MDEKMRVHERASEKGMNEYKIHWGLNLALDPEIDQRPSINKLQCFCNEGIVLCLDSQYFKNLRRPVHRHRLLCFVDLLVDSIKSSNSPPPWRKWFACKALKQKRNYS